MRLQLGYELTFDVASPTPMVLMLYVHPDRATDLVTPQRLRTDPAVDVTDYTDTFGNRCARIFAPAGPLRIWDDLILNDSGNPEPGNDDAAQHPVQDLPPHTLQYLLASRYCEMNKLNNIAWQLFGSSPPGYQRVKAICTWMQTNIEFGYPFANPHKTAWETYQDRKGVCRDFMHLACTFCRCLNIPARYATGYLGDIGVPPDPNPMDFSAYFEAYLANRWWPFDARHNQLRIGRVLIARGRDATDVAMVTNFGPAILKKFNVVTHAIEGA
jgi:transglutaminase-like putative cysteine protease